MKPLFACLFVADFPAAVLLRGERNRCVPPLAVSAGKAPNRFVHAANRAARKGGVRAGMPLAEAQARFAAAGAGRSLQVQERNPAAEEQTQKELLDLALSVSPRVEDAAPGVVVLDLAGLPDPHHSATALWQGAEKLGLAANVGVSQRRFIAISAARMQTGVTHVFPGQEAGFLSARSVSVLPIEPGEKATLERWGVRTAGELARLPEDALAARFGSRGVKLARLARGRDDTPLRPYEPPPALEESLDLDWELGEIEPLAFVLSGLLERLCLKLQGCHLAAEQIRVGLRLAGGSRFERAVALPSPLADPRTLLTLVRLDLEAHPPGEAVEGVSVAARPVPRRTVQFSLFEPALPNPEKLAVTLARLSHLVGPGRAGAPVLVDTHRPAACAVAPFAPQQEKKTSGRNGGGRKGSRFRHGGAGAPGPAHGSRFTAHGSRFTDHDPRTCRTSLVFRCFRPPYEAEVLVRGSEPVSVTSAEVQGAVSARAGPWKVCGEWWTSDPWQYEEWDVEIRGRLYRLCRDTATGTWHVTGGYD